MRILVAHNAYQQRGGEDAVVDAEVALLRGRGHEVRLFARHNDELRGRPALAAARDAVWSTRTTREATEAIEAFGPDVLHVHNTFPLISPAIHWAAARRGVPVVQTLHNFRLHCPQAMYLRDGAVCEDCKGRLPWRGVARACYRDSRAQTAVLAASLVFHRAAGTWDRKVTRFIALNEFCRRKFVEGGLPAERIVVKPNFVDLPAPPELARSGFLFVGRLSPEKGVATLADAAARLDDVAFDVLGSGPEEHRLRSLPNVTLPGSVGQAAVRDAMLRAEALVLPSIWYENFPRTLVEAFASGLPVLASAHGALAELVEDGRTGLLFPPGDAAALADRIRWARQNPQRLREMGRAAREAYERSFTADINYEQLLSIYRDAIDADH